MSDTGRMRAIRDGVARRPGWAVAAGAVAPLALSVAGYVDQRAEVEAQRAELGLQQAAIRQAVDQGVCLSPSELASVCWEFCHE